MDYDQDDLVSLIFGEHPPENWKDNPEFTHYLAELGSCSTDRICSEPDRVARELEQLQQQTRDLAASNYKTFIQTSNCSKEVFTEFSNTEQHLEKLISKLPVFSQKCSEFQNVAGEISRHRRLTSLTLAKHTSLLEVLELPQLMETVVRNHHYEEALQLHSYVIKLCKKQPQVKILDDIATAVSSSMRLMLQQLLGQLRAPVQLPQCLKVISYLRRMDVFDETELRLKFLQARETWLNTVVAGVPKEDPYLHLTRTMEVLRVHLFDIVTQYRSIFSDDTDHLIGVNPDASFNNKLLFSSWLSKKVNEFLEIVSVDLDSGFNSLESVIGQAMYFGLSFSRVGFDFRPLLVPLFIRAVKKQLEVKLDVIGTMKTVSDSLSSVELSRLPVSPPPLFSGQEITSPPLTLLEFPPLAHITNAILSSFNEIRLVCPLSLASCVTSKIEELLCSFTKTLLDFHSTLGNSWSEAEQSGFGQLCVAVQNVLIPYIQTTLQVLFPPNQLQTVSGLSNQDLGLQGLGVLNKALIMEPLVVFIPHVESLSIEKTEETNFVKDRMDEIANALDNVDDLTNEQEPLELENDDNKEEVTREEVDNNTVTLEAHPSTEEVEE